MCRKIFGRFNDCGYNKFGNSGTIYISGKLNYYVDDGSRCNNYPAPYMMATQNYQAFGNGYGVKNFPWNNTSRSCGSDIYTC